MLFSMKMPKGYVFLLCQLAASLLYGLMLIGWNHWSDSSLQDELLVFLLPPIFYMAYQYSSRFYLFSLLIGVAVSILALLNMRLVFFDSLKTVTIVALSSGLSAEWVFRMQRAYARIETALKENDAYLQTIFDGASDAIFMKDSVGRLIKANKAFFRLIGYSENKRLDWSVPDILDSELSRNIHSHDQQVLSGETVQVEYDWPLNGPSRTYQFRLSPLYDKNQNPIGICGIARDITNMKLVEMEREKLIAELTEAMKNVRQLNGLLPICSSCKKIRDDKGYWNQVEEYIRQHTDAVCTHGLCPECSKIFFGEYCED